MGLLCHFGHFKMSIFHFRKIVYEIHIFKNTHVSTMQCFENKYK